MPISLLNWATIFCKCFSIDKKIKGAVSSTMPLTQCALRQRFDSIRDRAEISQAKRFGKSCTIWTLLCPGLSIRMMHFFAYTKHISIIGEPVCSINTAAVQDTRTALNFAPRCPGQYVQQLTYQSRWTALRCLAAGSFTLNLKEWENSKSI